MDAKKDLRAKLRRERREFVAAIPAAQGNLLFRRPPTMLLDAIAPEMVIAVYHEVSSEAPASRYGRWFYEHGHRIALPWFADHGAPMQFRQWDNPMLFGQDLMPAPLGNGSQEWLQPPNDAKLLVPDIVFCPLLGFTADGGRIGYGGGHYDRWLAGHRPHRAIGLAWDCQLMEQLPTEPHDAPLDAVVTQSRIYGGIA